MEEVLKNKSILNRIDQLRVESDNILLQRQKSHIPCLYEMNLEPKNGYYFEGKHYTLSSISSAERRKSKIYLSKDIPFSFVNHNERYIDTLINLIAKDKIIPFIILANGIFIKWSDITIVKDDHYRYIIITGLDDIEDLDNIEFKCILLPCAIRYGENQNVISVKNESMRFYFDIDGYLTDDIQDINTRIEIIDPTISGYVYTKFEDNIIKLDTDKHGQITSKDNIIFIENNRFNFDKINSIEDIGHNYFRSIDSLDGFKIYSYTYNKLEKSNSLHYNIGNSDVVDNIIDNNIRNNTTSSTLDLISNNFNLSYDKNLSFKENIKNSLDYIMKYDSRLLDPIYQKNLKIITTHYTGRELLNKRDENGLVSIPRRLTNKIYDNYIMIFVNDLLYRFHSRVRYDNHYVKFPLNNINEDDNIEIIFFYNINNEIGKFTLNENKSIYIDSRFNLSNCYLYSDVIEGELFPIESPTNGSQTKIEFSFEEVNKNIYNITLNNPFFYGKELTISNPNQFRYVHYNAIKDTIGFQLPEEFAYCREKEKYMIFIDGRKINEDYFEIVSDTFDTPIFDLSIYTKVPVYKGSYIDIFYLPYTFDTISNYTENLNNKDIIIDYSKLSYRLNNYAYIYFINGKKLAENELINLSRNRVKLKIDPQSKLHLEIFRHVDPIECLTNLFIDSDYDKYIDTLSNDEIKSIFGDSIEEITDTEQDIFYETVTHKQLIYEVVKDYYMNVDLDILYNEFIYEYDDCVISEEDKDPKDNYVIRLTDASYEDKVDFYDNE